MKNKIAILIAFMFVGTYSFAQSKLESWKELKDFHTVMSQTFHPSEEGNLDPIKKRSGEMKEKAAALAASKVPAEFDNDKVKDAVSRLKSGSVKLDQMVTDKAADKEIKDQIVIMHNTFHEIVELCSKESEHSDKDKDHEKEKEKGNEKGKE
jgi:hypothetical protein